MSDIEFFAKIKFQKLSGLDEDFREWQKEFLRDEMRNSLKRTGKLKVEQVETTYERFYLED